MTAIMTNPLERGRFMRFAVVGVIGAAVDFGTFNLLTGLFDLLPVWASVLSFIAAVISNFVWNRYWTYPDSRTKRISTQLMEFTIISIIGLLIRTPLFVLLEKPLVKFFSTAHIQFGSMLSAQFLGHNVSLAIAIIVVMFWNFFVNRYWTYGDVTT